jgi:quercetin dioxygenase-like cupin family protein
MEAEMAQAGDVLVNPILRNRIVFRRTAAETNGESLEFDLFLKPHTYVVLEHMHPLQEERITVVAGEMRGTKGLEKHHLTAGESMVVPSGVNHYWGNDGDEESHWIIEMRPALKYEGYIEAVWGVADRGQAASTGLPKNLLQSAVIISEFRNEIRPRMPWLKWKIAVDILAPIGRRLGYSAFSRA